MVAAELGITKWVGKILRQIRKQDITIWEALVKKVKNLDVIDYTYTQGNRTDFVHKHGRHGPLCNHL